jgi:hypothetical protein
MSKSSQPPPPSGDSSAETAPTAVEVPSPSVPDPLETSNSAQAKPSYVKLAMRNMVRQRGKSLYHFVLTTLGLLGVLIGLAYLTR